MPLISLSRNGKLMKMYARIFYEFYEPNERQLNDYETTTMMVDFVAIKCVRSPTFSNSKMIIKDDLIINT